MTNAIRLTVIPIPGLTPDSLGNYLTSLGLLRLLARRWPQVRIAWRDETLHIVGGPATLDELLDELVSVAMSRSWTLYERKWATAQKESSNLASNPKKKVGSGLPFALWQAEAEEDILELFSAHIVPHASGRAFNPAVPKGGKASNRDFSKGWKRAVDVLANESSEKIRAELEALLHGENITWVVDGLNAASWFSNGNKQFNSGQRPFRKGALSPWAMALACEGLAFLAGGASRRLGARARARGAFPFVTSCSAAKLQGELERDSGEFWAPIWARPMTMPEVAVVFQRGRAEINGHGASTPSAFATAVLSRGIDAGLTEFRRFVFGWTTAADYAEPRYEGAFHLPTTGNPSKGKDAFSSKALAIALERVLALIERLPGDWNPEKRKPHFNGLRGPVEAAQLGVAASPGNPEAARNLLDTIVASLDRVDRNRGFRKTHVQWRPLPIAWLSALFHDEAPSVEARLAMALVSGFPRSRPFALYRFGVELKYQGKYQRFEHPDQTPARWVWGPGILSRVLGAVLLRRTLDWETEHAKQRNPEEPVRVLMPVSSEDVSRWLESRLDEDLLRRWLSRLALFDWHDVPQEVRSMAESSFPRPAATAVMCLFGLFQPLFDLRPVAARINGIRNNVLDPDSGARTPAVARTLANLIRTGQTDAAVRLARSRFAMADTPLVKTQTAWATSDGERLLAATLFTISTDERSKLVHHWLRPQRQIGEPVYV